MAEEIPERSTGSILRGTRPPLWLLMLYAIMSPFSLLLFVPALPTLAESFDVGLGTAQWTISGFLIGVGTMQLVIGPLVDRLGRRAVVLTGLIFFLITSGVAATVSDVRLLIGLRVAQAVCVASLSVVSRATVRDVFSGTDAGRAMSFVTLALQLPGLIAPAVGGALLVYAGWESLFLLLTAMAGILLALSLGLLPETRPEASGGGPGLARVFSDYARLARNPEFGTNAAIIALCAAAAMTLLTVLPAALTDLFAKSPDVVGYYTSAYNLVSITGAFAAAQLVRKLGVVRLMSMALVGVSVFLAGYLAWTQVLASITLPNLFAALSVVGFAQSIVISMGFARAVEADEELRGTASGLAGAVSSVVSAGFAAAGAILYASGLSLSLTVVFSCFALSCGIAGLRALRGGGDHSAAGQAGGSR